jgi:hypothetical protein
MAVRSTALVNRNYFQKSHQPNADFGIKSVKLETLVIPLARRNRESRRETYFANVRVHGVVRLAVTKRNLMSQV